MSQPSDYGILINQDITLHRIWFKQMLKLHGINCEYRAPLSSKDYDIHGDLDSKYYPPIKTACILQDHPDQRTLKKMGWVAELGENSILIHVPYDLPHLEVGALFTLPSAFEGDPGRVFRVINMQVLMIYPASITCEIAPEYESTTELTELHDFSKDNFTVLKDNPEDD